MISLYHRGAEKSIIKRAEAPASGLVLYIIKSTVFRTESGGIEGDPSAPLRSAQDDKKRRTAGASPRPTEMKNKNFSRGESGHGPSPVGPGLYELTEAARQQIELECFPERDAELARQIARIMAEVYRLPDECGIRIEGDRLPASMVKEVYAALTYEHVAAVIARFRLIGYEVRHPKSYIRTALYNAALETELQLENFAARV